MFDPAGLIAPLVAKLLERDMAKIAELRVQSCLPCVGASYHSPKQACRARAANNPPLYSGLHKGRGTSFMSQEKSRIKQTEGIRKAHIYFRHWSSLGLSKISQFGLARTKGGTYGLSQSLRLMHTEILSLKRLRKETRSSIAAERAKIYFNQWSSVGLARTSRFGVARIKGGSFGPSQGLGYMLLEGFPLQRLRKGLRSSPFKAASQNEDGQLTLEAEKAVERVLLEAGLSYEDAEVVVSKAPVYIRELVEFVSKSDTDGSGEGNHGAAILGDFDTRDRIYQLANHGRGRSPFLESLGVHLASISRISSSLSSQRLPDLLSKVRYLEELIGTTGPTDRPLGGLIQFIRKKFSLPVWEDEDIQRTHSFFEKLEHHEDGMGALEKTNTVVPLLIESFPKIFQRSLEQEIKPSVRFLEDLGINGSNLRKVLLFFPPILLQDPEKDLLPRKRTLKEVGIRVEDMGRMVVKYPWLLSKCVVDNVDELVQFLESIKVPKSKIDRIITRSPHLLGRSCTETLRPMVNHINGYGLKSKRLGRAIAQSPKLLLLSPEEFDTVVAFLESLGLEAIYISKLMQRSPEIMGLSIDSTLQKKIDVLEGIGVRREKLGRILWFFPEILSKSVESALQPRIKCLRDWGFSEAEISRMTFKFPPLLGYNPDVVTPKLKFLTETMRRPIQEVVAYPRYFSHSLERKIKPRARVLDNRQIQCDLHTMLAKSDDKFAAEFLGFESMFIPPLK